MKEKTFAEWEQEQHQKELFSVMFRKMDAKERATLRSIMKELAEENEGEG